MAVVDYASVFGIKSLAAPIVFAILYFPFFAYFLSKAISRPIYIYIIITFFCAGSSWSLSLSVRAC